MSLLKEKYSPLDYLASLMQIMICWTSIHFGKKLRLTSLSFLQIMSQGSYLAWLQSCAVMVQLEPNRWGRIGDDLAPKSENYYMGSSLLFLTILSN